VNDSRSFEARILPLLDTGYNLARWLLRDDASAEDAVQEAALRAFKYYEGLRTDDARPWFLSIVRNVCFTYIKERTGRNEQVGFDEQELEACQFETGLAADGPEVALQSLRTQCRVDGALRVLPPALREVIVLRELEDMSYEDIAKVAGIPVGTVMSRLSRARARLKELLLLAGAGN
jgi:RNA polymerase sigma-70 factor (ECF subfamily)